MPYEMIWHYQQSDGEWLRTVMVQLPNITSEVLFQEALQNVRNKNKQVDFTVPRFEKVSQGLCAQKLHFGHYRDTEKTVQEIVNHITEKGFHVRGPIREIYMNVPGWNPVENWQTIVRVPIQ